MIDVRVVDGHGNGNAAAIGVDGTIATAQVTASNPISITLVSATGAHNICKPVTGHEYCISDIVLATNKDIGVDGATIEIYEATSEDETTVDKRIVELNMVKNRNVVITGLHWKVNEGKFLNVKTDDDTVYFTIASHLVTAQDDNPAQLGTGQDV